MAPFNLIEWFTSNRLCTQEDGTPTSNGGCQLQLFTPPNPYAARQSRTQSGATYYDPNYDYNNYRFITSSGAIASVSAAMGD
jgi:hypothetical protein